MEAARPTAAALGARKRAHRPANHRRQHTTPGRAPPVDPTALARRYGGRRNSPVGGRTRRCAETRRCLRRAGRCHRRSGSVWTVGGRGATIEMSPLCSRAAAPCLRRKSDHQRQARFFHARARTGARPGGYRLDGPQASRGEQSIPGRVLGWRLALVARSGRAGVPGAGYTSSVHGGRLLAGWLLPTLTSRECGNGRGASGCCRR
jgi:hypothetical protein